MSQKGKLNCSKQLELFSLCGTFHQTNRKSTETTNDTKPLSLNPLHFCHSNIEDNREKKSDYSPCVSKETSIFNPLLANTFVRSLSEGEVSVFFTRMVIKLGGNRLKLMAKWIIIQACYSGRSRKVDGPWTHQIVNTFVSHFAIV